MVQDNRNTLPKEGPRWDEDVLKDAKNQADEIKEKISKEFKESPDGKKLQALLWTNSSKVFERIVNLYATKLWNKKLSEDTDKSILVQAIEEYTKSREHQTQTGILLDEKQGKELTDLVKKEFSQTTEEKPKKVDEEKWPEKKPEKKVEQDTTNFWKLSTAEKVPEFDILKRLADQWHITQESLETFKKENESSTKEQIVTNIQDLVNGIKDEKVKSKVLKSFGKEDEKEAEKSDVVTPDAIKQTDFYSDWGEKINEDRNISDFELRVATNYISIPKVWGKAEEKVSQKDKIDNLSMTLSKVGKQVITEQDNAFRETHANDIAIILNPEEKIETRYKKLEELFNEVEKLKHLAKTGQKLGSSEQEKGAQKIQDLIMMAQKRAQESAAPKRINVAELEALEEAEEKKAWGDIASLWGNKGIEAISAKV